METQIKSEPDKIKKGVQIQKITPFLWFDNQTEEAVNFYLTVFNNSKIKTATRYGEEGAKATGMPENSVMTMALSSTASSPSMDRNLLPWIATKIWA